MEFDLPTVLVVDDSALARGLTRTAALALGAGQVIESEDGTRALDILSHPDGKFALVLSDLNMPNLDGLELLKAVREIEKYKKLPFILISAEGELQDQFAAIRAGVSGSILKPVTPEKLKKALEILPALIRTKS